jgi:phospholipid/cholesterol/gamma-HCH transport system substrate-binding protein
MSARWHEVARTWRLVLVIGTVPMLIAGCQFGGLNSIDMPGTAGHDRGSYTVTVRMPDVATLPQNSPVMVDDVTVGSVSGIEVVQHGNDVYAAVQLSLNHDVALPANATAAVAQTSLLGSQHVELAAPRGRPATGRLVDGSVIELDSSSRFPTTEEVLSALGLVVNKGNLGALQDITDEAYAAVAGRAGTFAGLLPQLAQLTGSLRQQTSDIIATIDGVDRFSSAAARDTDGIGELLDTVPRALEVLNDNQDRIVEAFAALQKFAGVASRILAATKDDFAANLRGLYPIIKSLNDNADDLLTSLQLLPTFPFPGRSIKQAVRGDYLNVFITLDLTLRRLGSSFFTGSILDPNVKHLNEVINAPDWLIGATSNLSGQAADPFMIPAPPPQPGAPGQ